MSYERSLSILGELSAEITKAQRMMGIMILSRIALATPVDTGRARANWTVSHSVPNVNSNNYPSVEGKGPSAPGSGAKEAIERGNSVLRQTVPFTKTYIQNNLGYIGRLNEGYSPQADDSYVDRIVEEVVRIYG